MKGIDVSTYQGYPDWAKARSDGVEFAMIKASQGRAESSEAYLFADSKFAYNITNAPAAGIPCGVYHYFTAQTEEECDREAEFFLSVITPYRKNVTLWAAIDVESKYLTGLSKKVLTGLVRRFCESVAEAGYKPIVYTNPDWMTNRLEWLGDFDLWLALWRSNLLVPTGYERMQIWQWGASSVNGISGKVDTNIGYFSLPGSCEPDEPEDEKPTDDPGKGTVPDDPAALKVRPFLPVSSGRDKFRVGDTVRIEKPVLYDTGRTFLSKFRAYTIDAIDGDRVTVSRFGQWRVSVHIDNIEKVEKL